ncbi:MAG: site-2 protease family protein, partial [Planctomycetota bacterium]
MIYLLAILGFAFVIVVHELGHFVFAKWAGVRVDRFSVGMGPVIWSRRVGETEYALSLLPVGGYVKMLGQEDVPGREAESDSERSFLNKHAGWRAGILFGGVLFNLVSSWLILVALAWYGAPIIDPVVGGVQQEELGPDGVERETPAWRLGLRPGDRILQVNGEPVRGYQDIILAGLGEAGAPVRMTIERDGERLRLPQDPADAIAPVPSRLLGRPTLGLEKPLGRNVIAVGRVPWRETLPADPRPGERIIGVEETGADLSGRDVTGQMVYDHLLPF